MKIINWDKNEKMSEAPIQIDIVPYFVFETFKVAECISFFLGRGANFLKRNFFR